MPSPLYSKLKTIAADFTCGSWGSPEVLSPQRFFEKAEHDHELHPGPDTAAVLEHARGKWAMAFTGRRAPDSRGEPGETELEAIVAFTSDDVRSLTEEEIVTAMIGVIAEREFHEVLEWAQRSSGPRQPIVNPHHRSRSLLEIVEKVSEAMVNHAKLR